MADGGPLGLFQSLLAGRDKAEGRPMAEVALMVALADGAFRPAEQDALERALAEGELEGVTWQELSQRGEALLAEAPFFSEARAELFTQRWSEVGRRRALALAMRVGTAAAPLADEQQALLYTLAEGLGIPEGHVERLEPPWGRAQAPAEAVRITRAEFADPDADFAGTHFDALARSSEVQLRLLLYKLSAPRDVASTLLEGAGITEVGRRISLGDHTVRLDAVIENEAEEWWIRCLAQDEALWPRERVLWPSLASTLAPHQRLVLVHEGPLYPGDRELLARLSAEQVQAHVVPSVR